MIPGRRATDGGVEQKARRKSLAVETAAAIFASFKSYNEEYRSITRRARRRFEDREWKLGQRDTVERINLYDRCAERCIARLVGPMGSSIADQYAWQEIKIEFAKRIDGYADSEFFKTFFNSLTRTIFNTVGVNPVVEFIAPDLEPMLSVGDPPVTEYRMDNSIEVMAEAMLTEFDTDQPFVSVKDCVQKLVSALEDVLAEHGESARIDAVELLQPVFYRATRAFLVGRIVGDCWMKPLILAVKNEPEGIVLDTVITDDSDARMLFGFSRSYFHADLETVGAAVRFLQSVMPGKATGEFYTVLGRAKQGKTERYRTLFNHLKRTKEQFDYAEGERGMVMIVFSMPSSDVVFKVIRDKFPEPKLASRAEVMDNYQFVFKHDRVGRLVDAQEFRRLRISLARFSTALLEELLADAALSCREDGDDLIIDHCYIERRLRPLNLYLKEVDEAAAIRAIVDYGQAIRDLARTNVFPGDLLLKNFGVSRHGRVIFYDYDELCLVTDCHFRDLPKARFEEDELRAEPWFYVGPDDVFPEQFLEFLGIRGSCREAFLAHHQDILKPAYWRKIKVCHEQEKHLEVLPYSLELDALASDATPGSERPQTA